MMKLSKLFSQLSVDKQHEILLNNLHMTSYLKHDSAPVDIIQDDIDILQILENVSHSKECYADECVYEDIICILQLIYEVTASFNFSSYGGLFIYNGNQKVLQVLTRNEGDKYICLNIVNILVELNHTVPRSSNTLCDMITFSALMVAVIGINIFSFTILTQTI